MSGLSVTEQMTAAGSKDEPVASVCLAGIYRPGGTRVVRFGPRVPWPDGSIAARKVPAEALPSDG